VRAVRKVRKILLPTLLSGAERLFRARLGKKCQTFIPSDPTAKECPKARKGKILLKREHY